MTPKKHGGPGRNQGRKPLGEERGGIQPVLVNIYADQAERLKDVPGGVSNNVRWALDYWFRVVDLKARDMEEKLGK